MAEREKVIKALKLCTYDPDPGQTLKEIRSCTECPYHEDGCELALMCDALALLGAQKPRMLTLEEAEDRIGDYIHIEVRGRNIGEYRMLGELDSYSRKYRCLYVTHPGGAHCTPYSYNLINKTWRPWSARPTEEQRKAVKWE